MIIVPSNVAANSEPTALVDTIDIANISFLALSKDDSVLYVNTYNAGNFYEVDTATGTVSSPLTIGTGTNMAVTDDGSTLLIPIDSPTNIIRYYLTATKQLDSYTATTYTRPFYAVCHSSYAYVYTFSSGWIGKLNLSTRTFSDLYFSPYSVASLSLSPSGDKLYVFNSNNQVVVLNTANGSQLTTISGFGTGNTFYGATTRGSVIYAPSYKSSDAFVSAISTSTDAELYRVPVAPFPAGAAASPDGSKVYVNHINNSYKISVIDTATQSVVGELIKSTNGAAEASIALSSDGSTLYVPDKSFGKLYVFA